MGGLIGYSVKTGKSVVICVATSWLSLFGLLGTVERDVVGRSRSRGCGGKDAHDTAPNRGHRKCVMVLH
jgi:hypothetical protein